MSEEELKICDSTLHILARNGTAAEIKNLNPTPEMLLQRNERQETPLATAILGNNDSTIFALLESGAANSIFVTGYMPGSLVCTLPQTSQPPSRAFEHPPPFVGSSKEVLERIDEALFDHIHKLQAEKDAAKSASSSTPPSANPFIALPAVLKVIEYLFVYVYLLFQFQFNILQVGDIVCRGPNWTAAFADGNPPGTGTVLSVSSTSVECLWQAGGKGTYIYDPKNSKYAVQLFDQSTAPSTLPASTQPILKVVPTPPAIFKVGDKVRLKLDCTESSLLANSSDLRDASKACLGSGKEHKIGVIVQAKPNNYFQSRTGYIPSSAYSPPDAIVNVASLKDGALCDYPSSDLLYADGSSRGSAPDAHAFVTTGSANNSSVLCPQGHLMNKLNRVIPSSFSFSFSGGTSSSSTHCSLCYTGGIENDPFRYNCSFCSLNMCASCAVQGNSGKTGQTVDEVPLQVGDRVLLNDNFPKAHGDGWCLSPSGAGDKKLGVVLFALSSLKPNQEQRAVFVAPIEESDLEKFNSSDVLEKAKASKSNNTKFLSPFSFRSSWLERANPIGCKNFSASLTVFSSHRLFEVGDRVQLNPGIYSIYSAS
jgi:hypothetical protein